MMPTREEAEQHNPGPWGNHSRIAAERSEFTDDTIMTIAVAEALMSAGVDSGEKEIKKERIQSMKK